jgi:hypothetical protein
VLVVLVAVELLRGVRLGRDARLLVAGAAALIGVVNLAHLADGARILRDEGAQTRAALGALDVARPVVRPGETARGLPGGLFVRLEAGAYYAAADALGRGAVADSPAALAGAPEGVRALADAELVRLHGGAAQPAAAAPGPAAPPPVTGASGGTATRRGGCVALRAPGAAPAGAPPATLQVAVPADGVLVRARGGAAEVRVRRFAASFPARAHARLRAGATAVVRFRPDGAEQPWHVSVVAERAVAVCGWRSGAAGGG